MKEYNLNLENYKTNLTLLTNDLVNLVKNRNDNIHRPCFEYMALTEDFYNIGVGKRILEIPIEDQIIIKYHPSVKFDKVSYTYLTPDEYKDMLLYKKLIQPHHLIYTNKEINTYISKLETIEEIFELERLTGTYLEKCLDLEKYEYFRIFGTTRHRLQLIPTEDISFLLSQGCTILPAKQYLLRVAELTNHE
jgi:hypothetical protein